MAASEAFKKPHFQVHESAPVAIKQKNSSKFSCSNIIGKSLILIFVLVIIPLFPSQAPDFITQSLITNFWELVHLLFVGIAVCYGLFCRKCVEIETEIGYGNDNSDSIISGVLNISSFFENGVENLCISDNGYHESLYLDGNKKVRSFTSRNGSISVCENVKEKGSQIRNFQYFKGESLVVVSDGNCELQNEHKPLGLPVRSLRSGIADTPEFTTVNNENSRSKISMSDDIEEKVERIRGLAPTNLMKMFEEVATPSVVPLRSRSVRTESKTVRNVDSQSHFRLHSAGEFEFEHLESTVLQCPVSSSRCSCSSKSSSSGSTLGSSSPSIEMSKPKTQNSETEKDFEGSFEQGGALDTSSKSKKSRSIDSYSETEMQQKSKYSYLNSIKKVRNQVGDADQRNGSLDSNVKSSSSFGNLKKNTMQDQQRSDNSSYSSAISSNLTKTRPRPKSVRTIKSNKYVSDKMKKEGNTSNQLEDDNDRMFDQLEDLRNVEKVNKQKHHSEKVHPLQNQIEESRVFANNVLPPADISVSKGVSNNSHELSDEKESVINEVDDEELVGSEVDRKADEFIAKFRQQIRLQKIDSAKRGPSN